MPGPAPGGRGARRLPARVAGDAAGHIWMLWRSPRRRQLGRAGRRRPDHRPIGPFTGATDLELDGEGKVVVAGPPGDDLRFFAPVAASSPSSPRCEPATMTVAASCAPPTVASASGPTPGCAWPWPPGWSTPPAGHVDLFELDGRDYHQRWGRVFIDACIPDGTSVRVAFVTADDEPGPGALDGPSVPRGVPGQRRPGRTRRCPLADPPLVAVDLGPAAAATHPVRHREVGGDVVVAVGCGPGRPAHPFETYEGWCTPSPAGGCGSAWS